MKYLKRYSSVARIEERIAYYSTKEAGSKDARRFPLPLSGPLMPVPSDKQEAGALLRETRWNALRVTGAELAHYLGVSPRTLEKWEQGRYLVDPAIWKLFQLAIRLPEVRHFLNTAADASRAEVEEPGSFGSP